MELSADTRAPAEPVHHGLQAPQDREAWQTVIFSDRRCHEEGDTVLPWMMCPQRGEAPETGWNVDPEYLVNQ